MALSREQILNISDIKKELVSVPEWGGDVWVKGMTGKERDHFEKAVVEQRGKKQVLNMENVRARLVSLTVCDEDGKRLFSESDIDILGTKNAGVLHRLSEVSQRLSGIGEAAVKELADGVKDDPFDDSPTA